MRYLDIEARRARKLGPLLDYTYCYYLDYDYSILSNILSRKDRAGNMISEAYIMFDTETSKGHESKKGAFGSYVPQSNHICAFTISIRAFHKNIVTLRGTKPSELIHAFKLIREHINADVIYLFAHNMQFDYTFIRRYLFEAFGQPVKQLNVKNHYPLTIKFATKNGYIILRDSLILGGVSLERWASNLGVEHQKAVGFWDYDLIRDQNHRFTDEELKYIENDTLAGVECLNTTADLLGVTLKELPYTNTGIVRREVRHKGREAYANKFFAKCAPDYDLHMKMQEQLFHGGFTHANRYVCGWIIDNVKCYDFVSSYPRQCLTVRAPMSAFIKVPRDMSPDEIYYKRDQSCYIFKFIARDIKLKNYNWPMPVLQFSKCEASINAIKDNGRILEAAYVELVLNEYDLKLIYELYDWSSAICTDIYVAKKDYLPRWFRDIVFNLFKQKCEISYQIKVKGEGDISLYNLIKARLNSLYGLCVQKPVREDIIEVYEDNDIYQSGDYYVTKGDFEAKYNKYKKSHKNSLLYVWGIYVTSGAMVELFELAKCIGNGDSDIYEHFLYSDTDSIYSDKWNDKAVAAYNERVKEEIIKAGYGSVTIEDKTYWLGIAELDGEYSKFKTQGAKRYAVIKDNEIKITVAGVPKKAGSEVLKSLEDFEEGFVFPGELTGKMMHTYIYHDIDIDERGNEYADSIDLNPCDYTLSVVQNPRPKHKSGFDMFFNEEMELLTIDYFEEE